MLGFTGMWKLDICIEFDPLNTWLNKRGVGFGALTVSVLVLNIQRVMALLTNKRFFWSGTPVVPGAPTAKSYT